MVLLCSCGGLVWENRVHICGTIRCSCGGTKFEGRGHCCGYSPDFSKPATDWELWTGFRSSEEWVGSSTWGKKSPRLFDAKIKEPKVFNTLPSIEEIKKAQQLELFEDYCILFDSLLTKVILSEEYAVELFVRGLKGEIKDWVKLFKPKSLVDAYERAKKQDQLLTIVGGFKKKEQISRSVCVNISEKGHGTDVGIQEHSGQDSSVKVVDEFQVDVNQDKKYDQRDTDERIIENSIGMEGIKAKVGEVVVALEIKHGKVISSDGGVGTRFHKGNGVVNGDELVTYEGQETGYAHINLGSNPGSKNSKWQEVEKDNCREWKPSIRGEVVKQIDENRVWEVGINVVRGGNPWFMRMSWEGWIAWCRVLVMEGKEKPWTETSWGIIKLERLLVLWKIGDEISGQVGNETIEVEKALMDYKGITQLDYKKEPPDYKDEPKELHVQWLIVPGLERQGWASDVVSYIVSKNGNIELWKSNSGQNYNRMRGKFWWVNSGLPKFLYSHTSYQVHGCCWLRCYMLVMRNRDLSFQNSTFREGSGRLRSTNGMEYGIIRTWQGVASVYFLWVNCQTGHETRGSGVGRIRRQFFVVIRYEVCKLLIICQQEVLNKLNENQFYAHIDIKIGNMKLDVVLAWGVFVIDVFDPGGRHFNQPIQEALLLGASFGWFEEQFLRKWELSQGS